MVCGMSKQTPIAVRGRPVLVGDDVRTTVQIRATAHERDVFRLAASAVNLTVSEWARIVLRQAAGMWPDKKTDTKTAT